MRSPAANGASESFPTERMAKYSTPRHIKRDLASVAVLKPSAGSTEAPLVQRSLASGIENTTEAERDRTSLEPASWQKVSVSSSSGSSRSNCEPSVLTAHVMLNIRPSGL